MAAKITAFFITLGINIAIGVAGLFFLIIAMNGMSESDANYGLIAYIALALIVSLLFSVCALGSVHILLKREFNRVIAVLISVMVFSIVGVIGQFAAGLIGIGIAEFVRVNY